MVTERPAQGTPWLAAPFRPFYLLGAAYAVALMGLQALGPAGVAAGLSAPHGHAHEMLHGFAIAIIVGTVLTALPSWAGTGETQGMLLAGLAACWLLGRLACLLAAALPWGWVAAADGALLAAVLAHLAPRLLRQPRWRWRLPLVVLGALWLANLAWHQANAAADAAAAARALRAALWLVILMFTLAGGLLTPVFTAAVLAERGRGAPRPAWLPLEIACAASLVALGLADVIGTGQVPAPLVFVALATQGWRVARWRGWRAADDTRVAAMHLGFLWLLAALVIKLLLALGAPWPQALWVHAFTAGALGSMMLGLMTRVALRHTGRALVAPALPVLLLLCNAGAALRLAAPALGGWAWSAAALLWGLAFAGWLAVYAPMLLRASLPRN
jgi:uncharacterized protein involved in response to NO